MATPPSDNRIVQTAPPVGEPAPALAMPPGPAVGELSPRLVQEWGPILKPVGLGLLLALHSLEELTPGHPFFGWAHCTQSALAAYLDSSQDTIARYTNLLLVCGLIRVDEVETSRGKQKLYRAVRGEVTPSPALVEYLLFDADSWTRKHTAWLLDGFPAVGGENGLARLLAALRRAYTTARDAKGLATITAGRRLSAPGSFLARRAAEAAQAALPTIAQDGVAAGSTAGTPHGAEGASVQQDSLPASCGSGTEWPNPQPHDADSAGGAAARDTASCGLGGLPVGSAPLDADQRPILIQNRPASSGVGGGRESAQSGVGPVRESAPGGVSGLEPAPPGSAPQVDSAPGGVGADDANVIVIRSVSNDSKNENVNGAHLPNPSPAGTEHPNAPSSAGAPEAGLEEIPELEAEELIVWAARLLGDGHSLEWHRQMLHEAGVARYRAALEATRRAQQRGRVARPGAYFTGVLRRGGGGLRLSPPEGAIGPTDTIPAPQPGPMPDAGLVPATVRPGAGAGEAPRDLWRVWQAATVVLRAQGANAEAERVLRYVVLLELDPAAGWALLGVPNAGLRDQVQGSLAGLIAPALGQVIGQRVRVAVAVLPGGGRPAEGPPTLARLLAGQRGAEA